MKLKGQATLVFRDKDTGEITKEITKENTITNWYTEAILVLDANTRFGPTIFLSEFSPNGPASDPDFDNIPRVHPLGSQITPKALIEATASTFSYGEFHHLFSPPPLGTSITINTIGITSDTTVDADGVLTSIQAYVKLASPCIQLDNETLDVFYRITAPYDYWQEPSPVNRNTSGLSGSQTDELIRNIVLGQGSYLDTVFSNWNGNIDFTKLVTVPAYAGTQDSNTPFTAGVRTNVNSVDLHKYGIRTLIPVAVGVGQLVGFLAYGVGTTGNTNPWARGVTDIGGQDVIQGTFGHDATATLPFHDATHAVTGTGTLSIDGTGWTNPDFPKMYRLDITTTGGVAAGTYQFKVRNHFGFVGNTYKDAFRLMSSMTYDNNHIYDGFKMLPQDQTGDNSQDRDVPRWINYITFGVGIAVRKDSICIGNLRTETGVTFNVTNYPTFAPTNITQVTVDPSGTIYVGCRDTGIYKITTPLGTPTITLIDNTTPGLNGGGILSKCYGVHYGNSRLWAMFDGGLFSSVDNGANWVAATFTNATITAGGVSWDLVKFIKADPTHADQRLAIVYQSSITASQMRLIMLWWAESGASAVTTGATGIDGDQFMAYDLIAINNTIASHRYFYDEPWTYFTLLEPSPTGNKWGANVGTPAAVITKPSTLYPAYFTFGVTGKTQTANAQTQNYQPYCSWEVDSGGDEVICVVVSQSTYSKLFSLYSDTGAITSSEFRNTNDGLQGFNTGSTDGPLMYVGNMVHLSWYPSTISYCQIHTMNEVNSVDGHVDFQHILYDTYGWNGSAWQLDHAGSKTIHSASEVLSDGVSISFVNGTGTHFLVTDYYTFGVNEGVWLDNSTTIDHNTGIYYKKYVTGQTGLEAGTLSASTRAPDIFEISPPDGSVFTWQDVNAALASGDTVYGSSALFDQGARSVEPLTSNPGLTNHATKDDVHGQFIFGLSQALPITATGSQIRCGLSPLAVIGTAINPNTIAYGIELVHLGPGFGDGQLANVNIVENGVTVASIVSQIDGGTINSVNFEIEILNDGTVNYYTWNAASTTADTTIGPADKEKQLMYTSLTPASIVDYYIDIAILSPTQVLGFNFAYGSGSLSAIQSQRSTAGLPVPKRRFTQRIPAGYYHLFGEFANSNGRYLPNFFAVDTSQGMSVLIDGTEAMRIADNDTDTVLLTGEISVFPREGTFRYSSADIGKTVTATYSCLTTE